MPDEVITAPNPNPPTPATPPTAPDDGTLPIDPRKVKPLKP